MNNLARNKPLALVLGAAGFLGSHLTQTLLNKNIQVVGLDNFITGKKENLEEAFRNRNFLLLTQNAADSIKTNLPRLDYVFICLSENNPGKFQTIIQNIFEICENYKPKIILASTIDLYDREKTGLEALDMSEKKLAEYALKQKINARVVRLAAVFGPRMTFTLDDPLIKLIKFSVKNRLSEASVALDFTTRALFVDDAVNLLLKAIMHGSTSQKIYDGCGDPIKITEIRQILMDPLWHEEKGYIPTELPPWNTPNLLKTKKELNWKAQTSIIKALKETLNYFEGREIVEGDTLEVQSSKFKVQNEEVGGKELLLEKEEKSLKNKAKIWDENFKQFLEISLKAILIFLIIGIFTFPFIKIIKEVGFFSFHLKESQKLLQGGDLNESNIEAGKAKNEFNSLKYDLGSLSLFGFFPGTSNFKNTLNTNLDILDNLSQSNTEINQGVKLISEVISGINGENDVDLKDQINSSVALFKSAKNRGDLQKISFEKNTSTDLIKYFMPDYLKTLENLSQSADFGLTVSYLLEQIFSNKDKTSILVFLIDDRVLRPGGGLVLASARMDFDQGKLIKIEADSVSDLAKLEKGKITPPKDLANLYNLQSWQIIDAAFEPDMTSTAYNLNWFYNQYKGKMGKGVIIINLSSLAEILANLGSVKLPSQENEIDSHNLVYSIGKSGENSAEILKETLNKIIFTSKNNWLNLAETVSKQVLNKGVTVYFSDPQLYSYLNSKQALGIFPKPVEETTGERNEFLAFVSSSLASSQNSTLVLYKTNLNTTISEAGIVSHKLEIIVVNNNEFRYHQNLKLYLPQGTKIIKASYGGLDISKNLKSLSDYGWQGYSIDFFTNPKEERGLILEYQDKNLIKFENNKFYLNQIFYKQPGLNGGELKYILNLPASWKVLNQKIQNSQIIFNSDLTTDRVFKVEIFK